MDEVSEDENTWENVLKKIISNRNEIKNAKTEKKYKLRSLEVGKEDYTDKSNGIDFDKTEYQKLLNEKDLALLAGGYAREVLIKLIKMSKQFGGNFENFIDYIDNLKLGGNSKK